MNKKYLIIVIIAIFLLICAFFVLLNFSSDASNIADINANALQKQSNIEITKESKDLKDTLFSCDLSDVNTVLVNNSGILKLTNSIINKTGDTETGGDDADFYGVNSAVLVKDSSQLTIENTQINTDSKGSHGIFVTNTNTDQGGAPSGEGGSAPEKQPDELKKSSMESNATKATVKNVKITTHQDKSRGLDATFGGIINAENVEINTDGGSCAAVATDRGEGNITVKNSVLNTGVDQKSGRGSPLIYSTGNISAEKTKGTAYVSQIACIEGKNSISLTDCELSCFAEGNRKDGDNYVDLGGIFIYQSMSGDADVGTSTFNCKNTKLAIDPSSDYYSTAPMFHVTNTKANIILESSSFEFGSGILFDISGQNQWGNVGSNGGDVNLTAIAESLKGDIVVDSISSLNFNLQNTNFEGEINSTGNTTLIIDNGSTWSLTGDSNITGLENSGTINLNGHKLYVNGVEYNG